MITPKRLYFIYLLWNYFFRTTWSAICRSFFIEQNGSL